MLDGQTGGRAPRCSPQCLSTVPHGMRCHLFPVLNPHVSPTCKQTHMLTNTRSSWFGWEMRKGNHCHLLCRLKDFPVKAQQKFPGGRGGDRKKPLFVCPFLSFLVFSFLVISVPGLGLYLPSGTTCATNACISNTESGLCDSFSTGYQHNGMKREMESSKSSAYNNFGLSTDAKYSFYI